MKEPVLFLDMFSRLPKQQWDHFASVQVTEARVDAVNREITCHIQNDRYLSQRKLRQVADAVQSAYGIHRLTLLPQFPAETLRDIEPEELSEFLTEKYPPLLSVLAGCRWDIMVIHLPYYRIYFYSIRF